MEDENLYRRTAFSLSYRGAVEQGLILPFKVLISVVTTPEVNRQVIKRSIVNVAGLPEAVWANQVANQIALAETIKDAGIKKAFAFLRTIQAAEDFCADNDSGIERCLPGLRDHELRAALSCLLTAALAAQGTAAIYGDLLRHKRLMVISRGVVLCCA